MKKSIVDLAHNAIEQLREENAAIQEAYRQQHEELMEARRALGKWNRWYLIIFLATVIVTSTVIGVLMIQSVKL